MDSLNTSIERQWEERIKLFTESQLRLWDEASERCRAIEATSERIRLTRALVEDAARIARSRGYAPESFEADQMLEEATDVASLINGAQYGIPISTERQADLKPEEAKRLFSITLTADPRGLVQHIKTHGARHLARADLEDGVGGYLESPFRSPKVDRLLLLGLTDLEIEAYIYEMSHKNLPGSKSLLDMSTLGALRIWISGIGKIFVQAAGFAFLVFVGYLIFKWNESINFWGTALAIAYFVIFTIVSLIYLVWKLPLLKKELNRVSSTVDAMAGFYLEFHQGGPFSVRRFRERLQELANLGVVWPGPTWALLDDLERRGVMSV